jgi:hypothetical protein
MHYNPTAEEHPPIVLNGCWTIATLGVGKARALQQPQRHSMETELPDSGLPYHYQ